MATVILLTSAKFQDPADQPWLLKLLGANQAGVTAVSQLCVKRVFGIHCDTGLSLTLSYDIAITWYYELVRDLTMGYLIAYTT